MFKIFKLGINVPEVLAILAKFFCKWGRKSLCGSELKLDSWPTMVETFEIAKSFSDNKRGVVRAVDGVTFRAEPGKITGLLGANGAGKTTLLRLLSTVLRPDSGRAVVDGLDVCEKPEDVRARIGFMSTSTALYGRLKACEVLEYFGRLNGLEGAKLKERLDYVREKLNLYEFEDRLCDKLSTGQKQRVSIARSILHDPKVLFFDEPTAGLDVLAAQGILEFLEAQRDQGRTVVFSTHIMSEVERLCDRVVVVHSGKVRLEGSVDDVKSAAGQTSLERAFLTLIKEDAA